MKAFRTLVLATRNRDKVREIRSLLGDLDIQIKTPDDFPGFPDPEESADTLEGNALIKARAAAQHTGLPAMADDTGLEVDALAGLPGVRSARYSGPGATYEKNLQKLLADMAQVPDGKRNARFRCVIALSVPGGREETAEGVVEGTILREPRGGKGFGYDPAFVPLGYDKTFSELLPDEKNRISHRGKALLKMKDAIRRFATGPWG